MLRALFVSAVLVAVAGPALADDIDTCRDRQTEAKARLDACEKVIADDKIRRQGWPFAYAVGDTLIKSDYDGAIAAFEAAHAADPDNPNYINGRGLAFEGKGDDEHAMADYRSRFGCVPNSALAYNNRGTIYLRKGATSSVPSMISTAGR